ncbi:deacetylase [Microtetraspora sp. NBRC 13810]|uniref:polysaccharide deacetylase family protein n=1 Tax=Microtetraspora sp. NBRC 13810 TaxID=3030990 RepID=UPI0024A39F15|nr:polysaccharide deacetylase family protein [Microtetraspora sp. NBRC 13810]GLW05550.1 deacetylase [Microtetraspora sp. NBRC 13810]
MAATLASTVAAPPSASAAAGKAAAVNCKKVKCIALTFDDGPSPYTGALLDTLRSNKVKVTFFVVGRQVEKRPSVVRRMVREGHEVGNHTWDHTRLTDALDGEIVSELSSTQEAVHEAAGIRPKLMRPPFGATDQRVRAAVQTAGLPLVLWTGSTRDWELRNTKAITRKALSLVRPNGVILMHDIVPETVKAMPGILSELRKRDYHVVTVSSVLGDRKLEAGEQYPS